MFLSYFSKGYINYDAAYRMTSLPAAVKGLSDREPEIIEAKYKYTTADNGDTTRTPIAAAVNQGESR